MGAAISLLVQKTWSSSHDGCGVMSGFSSSPPLFACCEFTAPPHPSYINTSKLNVSHPPRPPLLPSPRCQTQGGERAGPSDPPAEQHPAQELRLHAGGPRGGPGGGPRPAEAHAPADPGAHRAARAGEEGGGRLARGHQGQCGRVEPVGRGENAVWFLERVESCLQATGFPFVCVSRVGGS